MQKQPIYAELSDALIREIHEGVHPVGALLPTELEIAAKEKVSRSTARAALNRLVSLGLVTRQKGVGTRVSATKPGAYGSSTSTMEELAHFGAATHREVQGIKEVVADEELARSLGCRPGSRWIDVSVIRTEPGAVAPPICWTDNYIAKEFGAVASEIGTFPGLIAELIAQRFGTEVDEVQQIIRPALLDAGIARAIAAQPGEPTLEIIRRYLSAGRIIYISVSQHPGDRFDYRMSLKRQARSAA
jgi:GntR family transcriptional regulator